MAKALVLMAEGFEEIELTSIVNVLRRGGVTVTIAALKDGIITGARGIRIQPDAMLDSVREPYDIVILPGGYPGYANLGSDGRVIELIKKYNADGKMVAAICGAPPILAKAGILAGRKATVFSGMEDELKGAKYVNMPVVEDGNVITSRGPGTAMEFALAILRRLAGEKKAEEVKGKLLYSR